MTRKRTRKQAKDRATTLHSLIVRARGVCEYPGCGYVCACPNRPTAHTSECRLQCAHIISRRYDRTRTDEGNAFSLCSADHWTLTNDPLAHVRFVDSRLGGDAHDALRQKATTTTGPRFDWDVELERLEALWSEIQAVGYARSPYGDVLTNGDNP